MQTAPAYNDPEYNVGFASRTGRNRRHNEDDYTTFTTRDVGTYGNVPVQMIVVSDGSGGGARGKVASRLAVQTLYQMVINNEEVPILQRMFAAVQEANGAIFRQALVEPQLANMRSTIIVAAVAGGQLYLARVGDSQAFLIRGGMVFRLTPERNLPVSLDMSFAQNGEAPAIDWQALAGLLGSADTVEVNVGMSDPNQAQFAAPATQSTQVQSIPFAENDTLLICTRSMLDAVNEQQISMTMAQYAPQEAANYLVDLALQTGAKDDITAIALRQAQISMMPNMPLGRPKTIMFPTASFSRSVLPVNFNLSKRTMLVAASVSLVALLSLTGFVFTRATRTTTPAEEVAAAETAIATEPALAVAVVPKATNTATETPVPTETETEVPTETATSEMTPTGTETALPTETPTVVPTETAVPAPTRVPLPTKAPAAAPAAPVVAKPAAAQPAAQAPAANQWWSGQTVSLLEPADASTLTNIGTWTWSAMAAPLPEGYAYELVFYRRGEDAMVNGQGWNGTTRNTTMTFNFDDNFIEPGDWNWTVLLVQTSPEYKRLTPLSEKRLVGLMRRDF